MTGRAVHIVASCLLVLLCVTCSKPLPSVAPQDSSSTPIVIRAGRVFDSMSGVILPARDILIRGNMIREVLPEIQAPAEARIVDLRQYTILPGLIDAHTHLLLEVEPYAAITPDVVLADDASRVARGTAHARSYLEAGFTTVRDLGNSGHFADISLKRAITNGTIPGPRMYVSGPGLSAAGGQIEGRAALIDSAAAKEYRIVRSVDDARVAVRESVANGSDWIKVYADQRPKPVSLSLEELRAIVEQSHLLGVRVAAHATSDEGAQRAAEAGVDSIEHGYDLADSTLARIRQRGITIVPTITDLDTKVIAPRALARAPRSLQLPTSEKMESIRADFRRRVRRLFDSGAMIVAGSDMYWNLDIPRGQAAKRVLFAYQQADVEPKRILQAATVNAATLLGEARLGVIEPGAFADIIALDGNPMEDLDSLERIRFVMKDGTVYFLQQ
jgi:imidazolonepropionase-like amidohydrolase